MPKKENIAIQIELASAINQVGKPQKLAYALTELRCTFGGGSIVPDIAVLNGNTFLYFLMAGLLISLKFPDWTIEILSPEQRPNRVIRKISICLKQGQS